MQLATITSHVAALNRLIRLPELEVRVGLKKSAIYKLIGEGRFPKPVRLGTRTVAWSEAAVLQWVQDRIAEVQQ